MYFVHVVSSYNSYIILNCVMSGLSSPLLSYRYKAVAMENSCMVVIHDNNIVAMKLHIETS